jgi:hypothetical protein
MINARVSETTKKAPFELWMGYVPRAHQPEQASALPRVEWHEERFKEARRQAQEAMKTAQHLWSQEGTFQPYQKDDQVWLEAKNLKTMHPTTKLCPLRYGPFRITEVISPVAYRLALPPQWKIHNIFHAGLLTRYKETGAHGPNYPGQVPDIVDGQEEYEVERILASSYRGRGHNRRLHLLIKWKGYPDAENTWEPIEDVFAPQLIEEFYANNPTAIKRVELHPPVAHLRTLQNDLPSAEDNVAAFSLLSLSQLPPQESPTMPRAQPPVPVVPESTEGRDHDEGQEGSGGGATTTGEEVRTALTLPQNRPRAISEMLEDMGGAAAEEVARRTRTYSGPHLTDVLSTLLSEHWERMRGTRDPIDAFIAGEAAIRRRAREEERARGTEAPDTAGTSGNPILLISPTGTTDVCII